MLQTWYLYTLTRIAQNGQLGPVTQQQLEMAGFMAGQVMDLDPNPATLNVLQSCATRFSASTTTIGTLIPPRLAT